MKTIHLIFNSHIDPVWLWPWSAGLNEIVNTCESMCNLLDRHPDVIFNRGEAWVYEQVERLDPKLFQRIKTHIKAGRWEVVGGWYIQPDCNLPGYHGLQKQIEFGRAYFESRFGLFPKTAFNVDSFGHTAYLPQLMAEAGQTNYVMMRPQEHELTLPARLFRWRTAPGGREITTFRVAGAYNATNAKVELTTDYLKQSLSELPSGIEHTMCFAGVGDHGGGPTEEMINWCREHAEIIAGCRMVFSSPARFFKAIARQLGKLPVVTGELQHHAIGCYSVHRGIKSGVRRAEQLLLQAESALRDDAGLAKQERAHFDKAWRWTCFNEFHDTLGGTCLPSSYAQAQAQLGFAQAVGDEILQFSLRRRLSDLKPNPLQRMVIRNFGTADFEDWIEHEPWLERQGWLGEWRLLDEKNREVPVQQIQQEAVTSWPMPRFVFKLRVPVGESRIVRIQTREKPLPKTQALSFEIQRRGAGQVALGTDLDWPLPTLRLVEDKSDTWSHGVWSYNGSEVAHAKWSRPQLFIEGPLLVAWRVESKIGRSPLVAEWRRYAKSDFIELRLNVTWLEMHRVLQLVWQPPAIIRNRIDGVSGGNVPRKCDGREYPLRDWSLLKLDNASSAGVVCPAIYSLSGTKDQLHLTLLRSAVLANHDPSPNFSERRLVISDRGEQSFLFRFYPGPVTAARLEASALALQQPPIVADLTRGMPGLRQS